MIPTQIVIATITGALLVGFGANEVSHGGFAETMGMGHQHMFDYGGYHCADPNDEDWDQHVRHMHGGWNGTDNGTFDDHCGAGHMGGGPHHGDWMGGA